MKEKALVTGDLVSIIPSGEKLQLFVGFLDRLNNHAKTYSITFLTTDRTDQTILTSIAYFNVKCLFLSHSCLSTICKRKESPKMKIFWSGYFLRSYKNEKKHLGIKNYHFFHIILISCI